MKAKLLATVLLLCTGQGAVAGVPQKIMSLKLCTDQLLMSVMPPEQRGRIASVTYLSREASALKIWPEAARIPLNHNSAEEVLAVRPDLILTDSFTSPAMRALLAKSGARLVEVRQAQDFEGIRANTMLVAREVGAEENARRLLAHMDQSLAALKASRPAASLRVAGWGNGGFLPGQDTFFNTVLTAAGAVNVAGYDGGYYDVEALIAAHPQALLYGDAYAGTPSLRMDQDAHPVLLKLYGSRRVTYPSAFFNCPLPQSADAALDLQRALARVSP